MDNFIIKDKKDIVESKILEKINQYKDISILIINKLSYDNEFNKIKSSINYLKDFEKTKCTILILVKDLQTELKLKNIFPDFKKYPSIIIFKNSQIEKIIEGHYIITK